MHIILIISVEIETPDKKIAELIIYHTPSELTRSAPNSNQSFNSGQADRWGDSKESVTPQTSDLILFLSFVITDCSVLTAILNTSEYDTNDTYNCHEF